jgi:hypothetical protein
MRDDLSGSHDDDARWVASATDFEPLALPERKKSPGSPDARRALYLAIAGMLGFGIVLSPLALALGRRARVAQVSGDQPGDAGTAHAAITLGKMGFALHLAIAISVLPWLLFMLPFLHGG